MSSSCNEISCVASFDMGKKNFAFCVEEFDLSRMLEGINEWYPGACVKKTERILNSDLYHSVLTQVYETGELLLLENQDISGKTIMETLKNMTRLLDEFKPFWDLCDVFLVEKQMNFGRGKTNPTAIALGRHCISYFLIHYPDKTVIEFPAYQKTQLLHAPEKMGSYQRKQWSGIVAQDILLLRNDLHHLELFEKAQKKDDIGDVILQLQAWKYMQFEKNSKSAIRYII